MIFIILSSSNGCQLRSQSRPYFRLWVLGSCGADRDSCFFCAASVLSERLFGCSWSCSPSKPHYPGQMIFIILTSSKGCQLRSQSRPYFRFWVLGSCGADGDSCFFCAASVLSERLKRLPSRSTWPLVVRGAW